MFDTSLRTFDNDPIYVVYMLIYKFIRLHKYEYNTHCEPTIVMEIKFDRKIRFRPFVEYNRPFGSIYIKILGIKCASPAPEVI